MSGQIFLLLASLLGFTGVGLGAFGAHAFNAILIANGRLATFQTGVQYHLLHAVVLLFVWLLLRQNDSPLIVNAGWGFFFGVIVFSGSLYLLALGNLSFMGAIAPLGGLALLFGWGNLIVFAWRYVA